ncbi:MAG: hypothetical protein M0R06_26200 [Sphaerochaeta sp.]|jgi:hypothetical protein|nr:hypothetical protein [Sphaerochaeta sp.]
MTHHLIKNWQTYLIIATTLLSMGIAWGSVSQKVDNIDHRLSRIEDVMIKPAVVASK